MFIDIASIGDGDVKGSIHGLEAPPPPPPRDAILDDAEFVRSVDGGTPHCGGMACCSLAEYGCRRCVGVDE